ncbi:hypothetical protein A3H75_01750 [Candidatus Uhrbacteria bacterium RIFCSPLOWO2_02_FULL_51_9]|uniref:Nudix hydrolase domain-containing protein n=1 Tax=Candidatus Uhrbacteria bacterium RIFCSPLOWO2_02_FULL_51_9 TaxID=1802410 RepID=A0A1F7VDM8_9BACT|nr:MAG: hypothetical protein A3H75_01750 [Candidatus Uhrbacteria bacterium RIFCSPLOWO2_02_FULL_51_9]
MKSNKSRKKDIKPWRVKSSRVLLEDRWIKVRADKCVTSDGIVISPYYVLEYPNWVHMVVVNNKNQILITKQYRHGARDIFFELPCGTQDVEDGSPLEAAKRELLEETGYKGDFILAGETSPNPANHSNMIYTFLVTNLVKYSQPKDNPSEVLNCKFIDVERVLAMIDEGKFKQALHISSLMLGLRKKQKSRS